MAVGRVGFVEGRVDDKAMMTLGRAILPFSGTAALPHVPPDHSEHLRAIFTAPGAIDNTNA